MQTNNDRFKFRVWHKIAKFMQYDDYHDMYRITNVGMFKVHSDYENNFTYSIIHYTNKDILMQCTGLKDKNGKLIYEGDIVQWYHEFDDYCLLGKIVWSDGGLNIHNSMSVLNANVENKNGVEVIGNIYEDGDDYPALMEVENVDR